MDILTEVPEAPPYHQAGISSIPGAIFAGAGSPTTTCPYSDQTKEVVEAARETNPHLQVHAGSTACGVDNASDRQL